MWPFSRRQDDGRADLLARIEAAKEIERQVDRGQRLRQCANDVERRSLCLQWAGEERDKWYAGRRQTIIDMIMSEDRRYKHMGPETRAKIGEMKWGKSLQAKELAGTEQMYSRWAVQYAGGPGSS